MVTTELIVELYQRYLDDLKSVRYQQRKFRFKYDNEIRRRCRKLRLIKHEHMLFPALDDLEAEILYLLLREQRPDSVFEMSPNTGWSTTWILSALRDNNSNGSLRSYDIHDRSKYFVPKSLPIEKWKLIIGDAQKTVKDVSGCDFFFFDSDHSRSFAEWYGDYIFPQIKPGCVVCVHDIYHDSQASEEGEVVLHWLKRKGLTSWTPASAYNREVTQEICELRRKLGIDFVVNPRSDDNSMVFFKIQ